jgi:pyruvate formate lyase activating enzyme
VLLDIKHTSDEGYKALVGADMKKVYEFIDELLRSEAKVWIRHVVVPGMTDSPEHILKLKEIISKIKNVEKVELLPYHTLGAEKYKKLGINYRLDGVPSMDQDKIRELEKLL